ncbi:ephrin-A2 [Tachysurus ichikawai]
MGFAQIVHPLNQQGVTELIPLHGMLSVLERGEVGDGEGEQQRKKDRSCNLYLSLCFSAASPHPNLAGKPCLKLRVYVKPTNDSVYESPEPFLTDDSNSGHFLSPCLFLMLLALLVLFGSS